MARNRCAFWFGTEERMIWLDTPLSGADTSPEAPRSSGTLLNGGGFGFTSRVTHRLYRYDWRRTSDRRLIEELQAYRMGLFGHGLIYFHDPLTFTSNVLPASWSAPGMFTDGAGDAVFPGWTLTTSRQSSGNLNLPVMTLRMSANTGQATFRREVFVPIPEGYQLHLGAFYQGSKAAPYYRVMDDAGNVSDTFEPVPRLDPAKANVVSPTPITGRGVYLSIRGTAANCWVDLQAMVGRLFKAGTAKEQDFMGPFGIGLGHSGAVFESEPTIVEYNGVGGGQFGASATFREVGNWTPRGVYAEVRA